MSWEALSALASLGTLLVVGATAIAALVQLHHLRAANQLNALLTVLRFAYGPEMREARKFVADRLPEMLKRPEFRKELEEGSMNREVHQELQVCDYYERIGSFIKNGLLSADLYLDQSSPELSWRQVEPVVTITRRKRGPTVYENFEYLIALSRRWDRNHPDGNYPKSIERLVLNDPWLGFDAPEEPADEVRTSG
jgi:hypothetical protein